MAEPKQLREQPLKTEADISDAHKIFWNLPISLLGTVASALITRVDEKRGTDETLNAVANLANQIYQRRL